MTFTLNIILCIFFYVIGIRQEDESLDSKLSAQDTYNTSRVIINTNVCSCCFWYGKLTRFIQPVMTYHRSYFIQSVIILEHKNPQTNVRRVPCKPAKCLKVDATNQPSNEFHVGPVSLTHIGSVQPSFFTTVATIGSKTDWRLFTLFVWRNISKHLRKMDDDLVQMIKCENELLVFHQVFQVIIFIRTSLIQVFQYFFDQDDMDCIHKKNIVNCASVSGPRSMETKLVYSSLRAGANFCAMQGKGNIVITPLIGQ